MPFAGLPGSLGALGTATRVLGGTVVGAAAPIVKKTFIAFGELWTGGWWTKAIVTLFELFLLDEIAHVMSTFVNTIWAGTLLVFADNNPKLAANAIGVIADEVTKQTPLAGILAARTIEQITGISIDKDKVFAGASATDRHAYQVTMGGEFTQVVSTMLDVKLAQQDFLTRTGTAGSFTNLASYFGTNLDFQLRSLTISTISSMFGWQSLRHLEGLHQSINWAFGFGWLSWSVLSNAMDVSVNAGVKRYYNALVKPHDLSQAQANKARIRNYLSDDVWKQIHANAGMRDDARDWQLALEFNQPSISTLQRAYEHGLATDAQIDEQMILHEYTPNGAAWTKAEIQNAEKWAQEKAIWSRKLRHLQAGWESQNDVRSSLSQNGMEANAIPAALEAHASERIYHLREAVTREHMKFLRRGLETEDDARTWLNSQGWTEEEIQLAFEANRLEEKAQKLTFPKHLTVGEIANYVAVGTMTPLAGQQYLYDLGYEIKDANMILGNAVLAHAIAITPRKIRDACETEQHLANLLTSALTAATFLDPLQIIQQSDYFRLVTCYLSNLTSSTSGTPTPPPPNLPPAPLNLTYAPTPLGATLAWQPVPLLADYQVYRRQIGQGYWVPVGPLSIKTTYADTGLTAQEIYIYVVRSVINGVESLNSNEVQVLATT